MFAESEEIYIREILLTDVEAIYSYRSLPQVAKFQYWEPYTKEQTVEFVEQCKNPSLANNGERNGFAIISKPDGKFLGDCSLKISGDSAEFGCNIAPENQKKGYAKAVLKLLIEMCFNKLQINNIVGITDSENISSIKLMESLGMCKDPNFEEKLMCKGYLCTEHKYLIFNSNIPL